MAFQLTTEVKPTALSLRPGGTTAVVVAIRNISTIVEHYSVEILGLPLAGMAQVPPEPTKLRPRESGEVRVTIALPENSAVNAGTYRIGARVSSLVQPGVARVAELTLEVQPVTGIDLSVYPEVVEGAGNGTFTVSARNTGNSPSQLSLDVRDEQGRARIEVAPKVIVVPPLGISAAQVSVRLPRRVLGAPQQVQLKVAAVDSRMPDRKLSAAARLVVNPVIPPGVARVMGIAVVVAVTASSIIVGSLLARDPPPPVIPTSVETTAEGPKPPPAPLIRLDPATPVVGERVTFTATVDKSVAGYDWKVLNADGITQAESPEPSLVFTPPAEGTYVARLTVTAPGGTATSRQPFTVAPKPPAVQVRSATFTLQPGTRVNKKVPCPDGTIAIGGGVVDEGATATTPYLRADRQTSGEPTSWSVSTRTEEPRQARYVAVCITRPADETLVPQRELVATPGRRIITATCAPGMIALGGGASTGLVEEVDNGWVRESVPSRDSTGTWNSWTAVVDTEVPTKAAAFVDCAAPPPGYQVMAQPQAIAGTGVAEIAALCPAGTFAVSGGAGLEATLAGSVPPIAQLITDDTVHTLTSAPNVDMAGQIDPGWRARLVYSTPGGGQVYAVAICATLE